MDMDVDLAENRELEASSGPAVVKLEPAWLRDFESDDRGVTAVQVSVKREESEDAVGDNRDGVGQMQDVNIKVEPEEINGLDGEELHNPVPAKTESRDVSEISHRAEDGEARWEDLAVSSNRNGAGGLDGEELYQAVPVKIESRYDSEIHHGAGDSEARSEEFAVPSDRTGAEVPIKEESHYQEYCEDITDAPETFHSGKRKTMKRSCCNKRKTKGTRQSIELSSNVTKVQEQHRVKSQEKLQCRKEETPRTSRHKKQQTPGTKKPKNQETRDTDKHKKQQTPGMNKQETRGTNKVQSSSKKEIPGALKCDVCEKFYKTVKILEVHKQRIHGWVPVKTVPQQRRRRNTNRTSRTMSGRDGDGEVQCQYCDKLFPSKEELRTHEKVHRKEFFHKCKVCKGKLATAEALEAHVRASHSVEKPFLCNVCAKSFSQSHHLREHMIIHQETKPFSCKVCGKAFNHRRSISRHLQSHAKDIKVEIELKKGKAIQCSYCSATFEDKGQWQRHLRTHSEHYKHECPYCSAAFSHKNTLHRHLKRHTGEKPHGCGKCSKHFLRLAHLRIHERTHTGEKPFDCKFCPKSFARLDVMKGHTRTVHMLQRKARPVSSREATYACRVEGCQEKFRHTGQRIRHEKKHAK